MVTAPDVGSCHHYKLAETRCARHGPVSCPAGDPARKRGGGRVSAGASGVARLGRRPGDGSKQRIARVGSALSRLSGGVRALPGRATEVV